MELRLVEECVTQRDNDSKSPEALYNLAAVLYEDISNPDNEYQSFRLYRDSAIMGYALAQVSLGFLYETGYGTDYNPKKAEYWYKKAISQNSDTAMVNLARLKIQGDIETDYEGAKLLLDKALQMNNPNASELLRYIEENKNWNFKQKIATTLIIFSIIPWTMFAVSSIMPIFSAIGLQYIKIGFLVIIALAPATCLLKLSHSMLAD